MQVKYALPGRRAIVDDDAKGIADTELVRHLAGGEHQVPEQNLIPRTGAREHPDFPLGDHEHVSGRLGIDISNRQAMLVLVDDVGRQFAPDNFAKVCRHRGAPGVLRQ